MLSSIKLQNGIVERGNRRKNKSDVRMLRWTLQIEFCADLIRIFRLLGKDKINVVKFFFRKSIENCC